MVEFLFTPEEAQTIASAIIGHFRRESYKVNVEAAVAEDLKFRPTLVAENKGKKILIEAQGTPNYTESLKELLRWANSTPRLHGQIYIATSVGVNIQGQLLKSIKSDGIGLLLVDDQGSVTVFREAQNPALVVTPDPTLSFGKCKKEVATEVQKFNDGERKAALQQMCEIVERETESLALKAARKGWLNFTQSSVRAMKWADHINILASSKNYSSGYSPLVSDNLRSELDVFRDTRNLVDHKARTKKEEREREMQFVERMMMGTRLIDILLKLQRRPK